MKRLTLSTIGLALTAVALDAVATPAAADPTAAAPHATPGRHDAPVIWIYGRPDRPDVVVEMRTPTAAAEAGAAHAALRERLLRAAAALRSR
jgi:hypothetical protein